MLTIKQKLLVYHSRYLWNDPQAPQHRLLYAQCLRAPFLASDLFSKMECRILQNGLQRHLTHLERRDHPRFPLQRRQHVTPHVDDTTILQAHR
jgi:hypothetical protein